MKKILLTLLLVITATTVTACGRGSKYPNALTIGTEDVPKTLNPYASADSANLFISGKIYNPLLGTHVVPLDYEEGKDYLFEDGSKYNPVDSNDNYYLFEDGLVKKEGAYPKVGNSIYGLEFYSPTTEQYEKQLSDKKIVFGYDELGNVLDETIDEFEKRREQAVPADDWMRYRFEVDTRYTWNDGEEFTAEDIVFTFQYALKHAGQLGSIATFLTNHFNCYSVDGDFVLELASNKLSDIKTICNSIMIVPQHIWDFIPDVDAFSNLTNPVGTGPYKLVQNGFISDASVALEFRDDYNEELTEELFAYEPIEHIFLTKLANEEIMLNALNKGDIDTTLNSFTVTKVNSLKGNSTYSNLNIATSPSSFVTTLAMNVGENGIFKDLDVEIREAISLAIDQQSLIDTYLYGEGTTVGSGLVTSGLVHSLTDSNGNYLEKETNIEKANEILEKYYPLVNGKRNFNLKIWGLSTSEVLINTIATMLNTNLSINVSFDLCTGDFAELIKQRNSPDFNMVINSVSFNMEQLLMFDARFGTYSNGSPRVWNITGVSNNELSSMMSDMDTAKTFAEQLYYCKQVQEMVAEEYVEIPLYSSMVYSIYQESRYSGWVQTSTGSILNSLSLKYIQLNQEV